MAELTSLKAPSIEKRHEAKSANTESIRDVQAPNVAPYARLLLYFARSAASRHRRATSATMMYVPTINKMASIMACLKRLAKSRNLRLP
jgi:hypothetical protein